MAGGGPKVVKDVNKIPKALAQLNQLKIRQAKVGIFDDAPSLVNIAAMNEFGVDIPVDAKVHRHLRMLASQHGAPTETLPREGERLRIPERSFLRATLDEREDDVAEAAPEHIAAMMEGETDAYQAAQAIGRVLQEAVIERVARGTDFAPNDPFTIALKGHARPLIGKTGVLETTQGIRLRVVRKS